MLDILMEAYGSRTSELKKLDEFFRELKKNPKDLSIRKDIEKTLRNFTGFKKLYFSVLGDYNAGVIPKYASFLPSLPGLFQPISDTKNIDPKISLSEQGMEYIKNIEYAVFFFGTDLMNSLTPTEMTAVMLHEIGHVVYHTCNMSLVLPNLIKTAQAYGVPIWAGKAILTNPGFLTTIAIAVGMTFVITRTVNFVEHYGEYNADEFAIKFGYGEEIASVSKKFHLAERRSINSSEGLLTRAFKAFLSVLSFESHPESRKRACTIIDKMVTEYKEMYPKLNKQMTLIYSDLKCQN